MNTLEIEKTGMAMLRRYLAEHGRVVEESDIKAADLKVDGEYWELKTGTQAFVRLSTSQYDMLQRGKLAGVFCVNQKTGVIEEYPAATLLGCAPRIHVYMEFSRAKLGKELAKCFRK